MEGPTRHDGKARQPNWRDWPSLGIARGSRIPRRPRVSRKRNAAARRRASFLSMTARLESLRHALCTLPDEALIALRHDAIDARHLAPSFTAWIKHMVDWELDRRAGMHYFLLFPEELVEPHEFARGARNALEVITTALAQNAGKAMARLLDALAELVSCCEQYR